MKTPLFFAVSCVGAVLLPLSLMKSVGLFETWEAFDRYQGLLVNFPEHHIIHIPSKGDASRDYARLDADLARWHADLVGVYDSAASMAVVGQLSSDLGLEFHFHRQAGAERRALKQAFYAPRDVSLLAYLAASVLVHSAHSVPLALLVLVLNGLNLGICLRLKALTDALAKSTEQLQEAQQGLLAVPLEGGLRELQQQAVCLAKLAAMQGAWDGTQFGYSLTLPQVGSLSVSVTLMASLAAATTVRCIQHILTGLPPRLRRMCDGESERRHGKAE